MGCQGYSNPARLDCGDGGHPQCPLTCQQRLPSPCLSVLDTHRVLWLFDKLVKVCYALYPSNPVFNSKVFLEYDMCIISLDDCNKLTTLYVVLDSKG